MTEIEQTDVFTKWLKGLRDHNARAQILKRLMRISSGDNLGDFKSVGGGIFELRFHLNKGYRVYFMRKGETIIVLLAGGSKATQERDIEKAKKLAKTL